MEVSRRQFLSIGAMLGAGAVLPSLASPAFGSVQVAQTPMNPGSIPKFLEPLPTFRGARIPLGSDLTIGMQPTIQQVLPAPLPKTNVWGYKLDNGSVVRGPYYPAFTLEAQRGTSTTVKLVNNLTNDMYKLLTVDQTLHWADPLALGHAMGGMMCNLPPAAPGPEDMSHCFPYTGPVPAVVHLHGGEVASTSDGGPDAWFTPGTLPPAIRNMDGGYTDLDGNPITPALGQAIAGPAWRDGVSDTYFYPNNQEAATIWFHDHALGATRINVYAGLAGFYFVRDGWDTGIPGTGANFPAGDYEIEMAIQDRMFDVNGQWFFPDTGLNQEHPFWIPEFIGDTVVVNGKTWPWLSVEPRRYRFRIVNGSNARTYELFVVNPVTKVMGPPIYQIGTDGGLMDLPAKIDPNAAVFNKLVLMPGERADIIIDFAGYAGQTLILRNTGRSPYPKGTAPNGATLGQILQFRVNLPLAGTDTSYNPATGASPRQQPAIMLTNKAGALATGVVPDKKRSLTLNEVMGMGGPLEILVNNTKWDGTMSPGIDLNEFPDGVTETPQVGATELWQIVNLTADAHPIHLHLTQFQLLNRQGLNMNKYNGAYAAAFPTGLFQAAYGPPNPYTTANADGFIGGNPPVTPNLQGPIMAPNPNELGWKDTVMCPPGMVTTFVVRYAPTDKDIGTTAPGQNDYPIDPTEGPGYVWHCHIIDHEDNEMMRPQKVKP